MKKLIPFLLAFPLLAGVNACPTESDADADGFTVEEGDCDDKNAAVYPTAPEQCDGLDNNCDGQVDEGFSPSTWYPDKDLDGYGNTADPLVVCGPAPEGYTQTAGDCDDSASSTFPGASELCDNLDNNCNGQVDEDQPGYTYYQDADGDGRGDVAHSIQTCGEAPAGYVSNAWDCDDTDSAVYPGAPEILDNQDNDCDGVIDEPWTEDHDWDGYTPNTKDCNDADPTVSPAKTELCTNAKDDDCDGSVDEPECKVDETIIGWHGDGITTSSYCTHGACSYTGAAWIDARVANLAYDKKVWAEVTFVQDGVPTVKTLSMIYERPLDTRYEIWGLDFTYSWCDSFCGDAKEGNISYILGYTVNGKTYYDDNGGRGYPIWGYIYTE